MRQPDKITINPSRAYPWYGTAGEGERFTAEQRAALTQHGEDPETIEAITVRRSATTTEMAWPYDMAAPVFEFECPVVQRLTDGRVKVIAPSGENKIVLGDGWVRRPRKATGWETLR